jgi:hypothetical protein
MKRKNKKTFSMNWLDSTIVFKFRLHKAVILNGKTEFGGSAAYFVNNSHYKNFMVAYVNMLAHS